MRSGERMRMRIRLLSYITTIVSTSVATFLRISSVLTNFPRFHSTVQRLMDGPISKCCVCVRTCGDQWGNVSTFIKLLCMRCFWLHYRRCFGQTVSYAWSGLRCAIVKWFGHMRLWTETKKQIEKRCGNEQKSSSGRTQWISMANKNVNNILLKRFD